MPRKGNKGIKMAGNIYLWLVEQYQGDEGKQEWNPNIEVCGVFDTEQKAVDACIDEGYWIVRVELNKSMPHETMPVFVKDSWEPYYPWMKEDGTWDDKPMIRKPTEIKE
jgi:hypothetical protein